MHESERSERLSNIQQQINVMLHECSIEGAVLKFVDGCLSFGNSSHLFFSFYLTSIYDHSIHEAFSKIVQSQMRQLRALENMLDIVTEVGLC